jgi:sugar lactone lactonase YvrE
MQTPYGPNRLLWGLVNFAAGIDGIEISEDQKWLYLAPMTNSRLCRIPMAVVLDPSLSPETFSRSAEEVGQKPMSDGIAIDREGRVVITDVEHGAIMALNPTTKQLSKLGGSKDIAWPDGIVVANDGDVYFTDSAIPSYIDQLSEAAKRCQAPTTPALFHLPFKKELRLCLASMSVAQLLSPVSARRRW